MKLSAQDRVLTLLQSRTQKEVAKKLGVSERTIRRWKNENVQPCRGYEKKLTVAASRERRSLREKAERQGFKQPDVPVPLPARRQTRIDPRDPKKERRIPSDTVIYNVEKARLSDVLALLQSYRKTGSAFRVIYQLKPGVDSSVPGGMDKGERKKALRRHQSTAWEFIDQRRFESADGFLDYLNEILEIGKAAHVVFTDPKHKGRDNARTQKRGKRRRK